MVVVGHGLLSSPVQEKKKKEKRNSKKKLDILTAKIKLAPRNLPPLICRQQLKEGDVPFSLSMVRVERWNNQQ